MRQICKPLTSSATKCLYECEPTAQQAASTTHLKVTEQVLHGGGAAEGQNNALAGLRHGRPPHQHLQSAELLIFQ